MGILMKRRASDLLPFAQMREELDRAMAKFWSGEDAAETGYGSWMPQVDVSESDKMIELKVDLPGMDPEEIDISVSGDGINIKGERKSEREDKQLHRIEREYGSFFRRIPLPASANAEEIKAVADKGVVTITIPKRPEAESKRINVSAT